MDASMRQLIHGQDKANLQEQQIKNTKKNMPDSVQKAMLFRRLSGAKSRHVASWDSVSDHGSLGLEATCSGRARGKPSKPREEWERRERQQRWSCRPLG